MSSRMIKTTLKLHYSQTLEDTLAKRARIKTTLKLHYSQTLAAGCRLSGLD